MQPRPTTKQGLPVGSYENGQVIVSISDYEGKTDILHINEMPMMNDDVYVSYSKRVNKGWGLFAKRQLIGGNIILQYRGKILRENKVAVEIEKGHSDYITLFSSKSKSDQLKEGYLSPNYAIDAFPYVPGEKEPLERIGGFSIFSVDNPNAFISEFNGDHGWTIHDIEFYRLFMYANRNIRKDEEIICDYGHTQRGYYIDIPRED